MRQGKVWFVARTRSRALVLGLVTLAGTASAQDEAKPPVTYPDLPGESPRSSSRRTSTSTTSSET